MWSAKRKSRTEKKNIQGGRERGAVVVEAVISMTAFIFAILIILSVADIAYTQCKMAVALNSAAKEMSQYSFLYYKFRLDELNKFMSDGTEGAQKTVEDTMDGLGQMMDSFGNAGSALEEGSFDRALEDIRNGASSGSQTVSALADQVAEDPKAFLIGMGKLAGREATEAVKVYLGQVMARAFMSKNLKSFAGDDPDAFLRRLHVADGMDGLDFTYTSLMAYGDTREIQLVCTYDVQVVRLLNIDFAFTFRQIARTQAWGSGVSRIVPDSAWAMNQDARGKYIIEQEKKGFVYTSSGHGYHAYVNSGGKNEFVRIVTMDPTSASYQSVNGIKNKLSSDFDSMYAGVGAQGSEIPLQKGGGEETVHSDPETRTYRLVVVLPSETSAEDRKRVDDAIRELQARYYDTELAAEVKEKYGALPKPTAEPEAGK